MTGSDILLRPISILLFILTNIVICAAVKAYHVRRSINNLRKQGLPVAEWNWVFGSMTTLKKHLNMLPDQVDIKYALTEMAQSVSGCGVYVDLWPLTLPILVLSNPAMVAQSRDHGDRPVRPRGVNSDFERITGGPSLLTMPNALWKPWRAAFNPGFSSSCLLQQTAAVVQCVEGFTETLRKRAKEGNMFKLEEHTIRLALDVIGIVVLGKEFDYQRKQATIPNSLRAIIAHTYVRTLNPLKKINPISSILLKYHDHVLKKEIGAELEKRFAERKADRASKALSRRTKSIIALTMDVYMKENEQEKGKLDPAFKLHATSQLRLFMFAGHGTVSSTIIYAFHLLSQNSFCLSRLRAEHDEVLTTDIASAGLRLSSEPALVNKLHYTTAVIKETLRLYPPGGSAGVGDPNLVLTDADGTRYPTENITVFGVHFAIHRNPRSFPDPASFIPDRWLVAADHPLHPSKDAYRPFELGARNCIGQTLAMLEIKLVLALTAREFDVVPAYEEWDRLHPGGKKIKTALGERAYHVVGTAVGGHPADNYPCRVISRN